MAEIIDTSSIGTNTDPAWRVSLNANKVDGTRVKGGYAAWQLMPNGEQIAPVDGVSEPVTVADANALTMTPGGGGRDEMYFARGKANFTKGELVILTGPIPQGGNRSVMILRGEKSTLSVNFEYAGN